MKPIIVDNFLSSRYFSKIKENIESNQFNWNYKRDITTPNIPNNDLDSYGFEHRVIESFQLYDSNTYDILTSFYCDLLDITECSNISKSRIDMVTHSAKKYKHTIHIDEFFPHTASVFYLTESDAETVFYNTQCFSHEQYRNNIDFNSLNPVFKVEPKENRLIFFDGSYLHTGCSPAKYKNRIIINTDLVK